MHIGAQIKQQFNSALPTSLLFGCVFFKKKPIKLKIIIFVLQVCYENSNG